MSRGGWYRGPDGHSTVHLLFGSGRQAPGGCASPCLEGDNPNLFAGRCMRLAPTLCDGVVGETIGGKPITCDAAMCEQHRTRGGDDIDYCPKHRAAAQGDAPGE